MCLCAVAYTLFMNSPSRVSVYVDTESQGYGDLLKRKEKEYRQLWEQRYNDLQELIRKKDAQYATLQSNFSRLQDDFTYNLQLIQERDTELQKYDVAYGTLNHSLSEKDEKISNLKNDLLTIQEKLNNEQTLRFSQSEAARRQIESLQSHLSENREKEDEISQRHHEQFDAFRSDARQQIRDKEQALEDQRRELITKYESIKRDLETENARFKGENTLLQERLDSEISRAAKLGEVRNSLEHQTNTMSHRAEAAEEQLSRAQRELAISRAHAEELEHLSDAVSRDATQWKDRATVLENSLNELRVRLSSDLEGALREKADAISRMQSEGTERVAKLTSEHSKQLMELQEDHTKSIRSLLDEHRQQLDTVRGEHETKLNLLLASKQKELEETEARHSEYVKSIKLYSEREIENTKYQTSRDLDALRIELSKVASERDVILSKFQELDIKITPHLRANLENAESEVKSLSQQLDTTKKEAAARKDEVNRLQNERTTIINRSDETILKLQSDLAKSKAQLLTVQSHIDTRALTDFKNGNFPPSTPHKPLFPGDLGSPSPFVTPNVNLDSAKISELESANERLRTIISAMREDTERMHAQFSQLQVELEASQRELSSRPKMTETNNSDLIMLSNKLHVVEAELASAQMKISSIELELKEAYRQLELKKGDFIKLESDSSLLRSKIHQLESEMTHLEDDRNRLMELNNELRSELNQYKLSGEEKIFDDEQEDNCLSSTTIQIRKHQINPAFNHNVNNIHALAYPAGAVGASAASRPSRPLSGHPTTHIYANPSTSTAPSNVNNRGAGGGSMDIDISIQQPQMYRPQPRTPLSHNSNIQALNPVSYTGGKKFEANGGAADELHEQLEEVVNNLEKIAVFDLGKTAGTTSSRTHIDPVSSSSIRTHSVAPSVSRNGTISTARVINGDMTAASSLQQEQQEQQTSFNRPKVPLVHNNGSSEVHHHGGVMSSSRPSTNLQNGLHNNVSNGANIINSTGSVAANSNIDRFDEMKRQLGIVVMQQTPAARPSTGPFATAVNNSERATGSQIHASEKLKSVHARRQELLDKRRGGGISSWLQQGPGGGGVY